MINLSIPKDEQEMKPRITVVGVGGAGGNAVNNMIRSNLVGCEFVACNTDAQALQQSTASRKIQLGIGVTRGLGAGSRPDVGRAAAEEALDEILEAMQGSNMVFITAGMGGGTGTGGAPVIARIGRESGILTVGVVTKPFHFEGSHRMRTAELGIEELQKFVDTLIIIPNTVPAATLREAAGGVYTQPMLTQNAAQSPIDGLRESPRAEPLRVEHDNEPVPQAAEAAENAAMRNGSFVVPKPADAGLNRPVPLTHPAVPPAPGVKEPAPKPKGRVPSLIERVTGVGRARIAASEPAPRPTPQPTKQVAQPRLTPLEPDDRPGLSKEEDLLDIPAFLRRQAN